MNTSQPGGGSWVGSLITSSLLFLVPLAAIISASLSLCQGHLGYPLDDTYIHMAMAKNFALHGMWGITRYAFSSSTSSPLYTLMLAAAYALTGVREITPLILNIIAGLALLFWSDFVLRRQSMPFRWRVSLLCLIVFAVPLYTLVLVAMEHVFHTLATLIFLHFCCTALADQTAPTRRKRIILLSLAPLLIMLRYEGAFLIAAAGLLFLLRRAWMLAAELAVAAALPLLLYGWISVRHGWYLIPNSLILKANLPGARSTNIFGNFTFTLLTNLKLGSHVVVLILLASILIGFAWVRDRAIWNYPQLGLMLFVSSAAMHLFFARVGWFYRYESYLVAFGILTIAVSLYASGGVGPGKPGFSIYGLAALFLILVGYRTVHATMRAPQAISDIYDQQYQMGLFAQQNLAGETIVLNDIGAVSFLADVKILDLIGLGSVEPATARLQSKYSAAWLSKWSHDSHAAMAITYPKFASPEWVSLETWTIPGNYMSASDTVGIFAVDPAFGEALRRDLQAFRMRLPGRVVAR